MKWFILKIILITFLSLFCINLFSQDLTADNSTNNREPPVVGFFPFTYSTAAGKEIADNFLTALAKTMVTRASFQPYTISPWLDQEYALEKAKNMEEILDKARELQYPADFFCEGTVFKAGGYYGAMVSLHPLDKENYTSYYYRYFQNTGNLSKAAEEIINEMEKRAVRYQVEELIFDKIVLIEKMTPQFLFKTPVSAGEAKLAQIPAINIEGVDFTNTDHFFNALLAYNFHISRLFDVRYSKTNKYLINQPESPDDIDFIISVDLIATDKITTLRLVVLNAKTYELLFHYIYPFGRLNLIELNNAFRKNALTISTQLLNEKELKKVGIVNLNVGSADLPVYYKDYFIGKGSQQNTLLPFGLNEIVSGTKSNLKFVLPFALSKYAGDEEIQSADLLKMLQ